RASGRRVLCGNSLIASRETNHRVAESSRARHSYAQVDTTFPPNLKVHCRPRSSGIEAVCFARLWAISNWPPLDISGVQRPPVAALGAVAEEPESGSNDRSA